MYTVVEKLVLKMKALDWCKNKVVKTITPGKEKLKHDKWKRNSCTKKAQVNALEFLTIVNILQ